ncbi:MAG: 6,7-dimethyl-8-ribityllumazine synthase [Phycisphaera sp.]|nr:6,7-dimethyl-8-ribityllumazine synthase [Phycisphaera sp.]
MPNVLEGESTAGENRFAIVVARFNNTITDKLLAGCLDTLRDAGADIDAIPVAKVPGSLELPIVARHFAESGGFDAVIVLGCVIRGKTTHYDAVVNGTQQGCTIASQETGVPVIFGVITAEDRDQAEARADVTRKTNIGRDAANAALEMANLLRKLPGGEA